MMKTRDSSMEIGALPQMSTSPEVLITMMNTVTSESLNLPVFIIFGVYFQ